MVSSSKRSKSESPLTDGMKICMKRKGCLEKKIYELSTLCGIETCMIFYGPDGNLLTTWPENQRDVVALLKRYNSLSLDAREKHKLDLSSFIEAKIKKKLIEKECRIPKAENSGLLYPSWDNRYDEFPVEKLKVLEGLLGSKLERVKERLESFKFMMNKQMMGSNNIHNDEFGDHSTSMFSRLPNRASSTFSSMGPHYPMSSSPVCNYPGCDLALGISGGETKQDDLPPLPHSLRIVHPPQPITAYMPVTMVPQAQPVLYSFQPVQAHPMQRQNQFGDHSPFLKFYYSHHHHQQQQDLDCNKPNGGGTF